MARNPKPRRRTVKRTNRSGNIRRTKQLSFEQLESRHLLATFVVNSVADGPVDLTDSVVTLRDAITSANDLTGADTITFDASVFTGGDASLIRLSGTELEITDPLTVDASMASGVTITGDTNGNDFVDAMNITNVAASFGSVAGDLLDDNSRVLNFNSSSGDLTLRGLTITGGRKTGAGADGGGIRFGGSGGVSGTLTLDQTTVSGNSTAGTFISGISTSTARGGGIFTFDGNVVLTNSTVSGNSVSALAGLGGGIYTSDGGVLLTTSTISGNSSTRSGGGIYTRRGNVTLTNSTISGNVAGDAGGGIAASSASVTLINSTVSGNEAVGLAGGIFVRNSQSNDPSVTISNSIVAGNQQNVTTPNIGTPNDLLLNLNIPLTINYSLIGVADSGLTAGQQSVISNGVGNLTGTSVTPLDPLLDLLADNGGPTQTHAILFGSPAINAGDPAITGGFDQRGQTRVQVDRVDVGAFESAFESPSLNVTINSDTVANDDETSLREAIDFANLIPGADTITFDASVFTGGDASLIRLTSGELEIADTLTIDGSTGVDVTITGDRNDDDVTDSSNITDVSASFGGTPRAADDLLDDNSRLLNFSSLTGDLSLESLTLTGGRTRLLEQSGGGIRSNSYGVLSLTNSTLSGNSTSGDGADGGGIYTHSGAVSLTSSTLSGNSTSGNFAFGGGIFANSGNVSLTSSTLSGNSTSRDLSFGGGISTFSGDVSLTSSTLSGNSTSGDGADGGGIYTRSGAVSLTSSTLSENEAALGAGGGVFVFDSTSSESFTIENSIIAGNTDDGTAPDFLPDPDNTLTINHSLIGSTNLTIGGTGNQIGDLANPVDPLLGPLADNGGPTLTHALLPGSPAINVGDNTLAVDTNGDPLLTDQRGTGFDRIFGGTVDIGAFELDPPPFLLGDINQDGVIDFADIPSFISVLQSGVFLDEADINGDGVVDFADIPFFIDLLIAQ